MHANPTTDITVVTIAVFSKKPKRLEARSLLTAARVGVIFDVVTASVYVAGGSDVVIGACTTVVISVALVIDWEGTFAIVGAIVVLEVFPIIFGIPVFVVGLLADKLVRISVGVINVIFRVLSSVNSFKGVFVEFGIFCLVDKVSVAVVGVTVMFSM